MHLNTPPQIFRLLLVSTGVALAMLGLGSVGTAGASEPPAPEVTAISPNHGPWSGGTAVVVSGANFTGATAVKFGPYEAESFTVDSDSEITAVSPEGYGPGQGNAVVDISVTASAGTSEENPSDRFSYGPTIDALVPNHGPASGGTAVTLLGFGLEEAAAVHFGTVPAESFTVNPDGSVTAISPPRGNAETIVPISVTTPEGTSENYSPWLEAMPVNFYTYGPTVTGVTPAEGPEAGGTLVTIHGTGFKTPVFRCLCGAFVESVAFGSSQLGCGLPFEGAEPACSPIEFEVKSETEIVATTPPGGGTVDVGVFTEGGLSPADPAAKFTYEIAPQPLPEGEAKMLQLSCTAPRRLGRGEVSRACSSRSVPAGHSGAAGPIKAHLYRGHALYARGTANLHRHRARLLLKTLRTVKPGRYALVLSSSRDSSRFPRRELIVVR